MALAIAALAAADVEAAQDACAAARQPMSFVPGTAAVWRYYMAQSALAGGDLVAARRWADDAVATATGFHLMAALATRARVAIAQGEPEQADRDAHDALECAARLQAYQQLPDTLECLAELASDAGTHDEAARLFGAAEAFRQRVGMVRFKVWDASYETSIAALRDAMGDNDFDHAWAEGVALSTEEAIVGAQRGRRERKRPTSGWASLTPTERDVVRLVSGGLTNHDIAARMLVSPRTVQTHLTHVFTKLGLHSRVQLIREAARHA
jgi:DNA-binding CsgD family transcriptional regulator